MKKTTKTLLYMGTISIMVAGSTVTSLAGTWRMGTGDDVARWWYDFDNGSYAAGGWATIDGNNDGIAETYFFDAEGWMLADTVTPDGQTVNADGAWTVGGAVVQTSLFADVATQAVAAQDSEPVDCWMWNVSADGIYTENKELISADMQDWYDSNSKFYLAHMDETMNGVNFGMEEKLVFWAENSERGAAWKRLFDRYKITPAMLKDITDKTSLNYTFKTAPGMSLENAYCVTSAIKMMMDICTDGMAKYSWNSNHLDDGTVVVEITVEFWYG